MAQKLNTILDNNQPKNSNTLWVKPDGESFSLSINSNGEWKELKGEGETPEPEPPQSTYVEITYTELRDLRDNNKLVPGTWYRITDYICKVNNFSSPIGAYEHQFDILVLATSTDALNENARAVNHEGDTYFKKCNLNAWEIKYTLDNDLNKFSWALPKTDLSIEVYDDSVRNYVILVRDYSVEPQIIHPHGSGDPIFAEYFWKDEYWGLSGFSLVESPNIGDPYFNVTYDRYENSKPVVTVYEPDEGKGVIYYMKDEFGNECPYDFKNINIYKGPYHNPEYTFTKVNNYNSSYTDATIPVDITIDDVTETRIYAKNNIIKPCYGDITLDDGNTIPHTQIIQESNMIGDYIDPYGNVIDLYPLFINNYIGYDSTCSFKSYLTGIFYCIIGNNSNLYSLYDCTNITIGNFTNFESGYPVSSSNNITIGNGCYNISMDNSSNVYIGNECSSIYFGNIKYANIGNRCEYLKFKKSGGSGSTLSNIEVCDDIKGTFSSPAQISITATTGAINAKKTKVEKTNIQVINI